MKLVAAAKVNKMQKKVLATRPFTEKVKAVFRDLQGSMSQDDIERYPLLRSTNDSGIKTVLLMVISSDRGLCGGYNSNILKMARKRIQELQNENKTVKLLTIGRKATVALQKVGVSIEQSFTNLQSIPTIHEASLIAERASDLFTGGTVDEIEIISSRFINLVSSEVQNETFLPVKVTHLTGQNEPKKKSDPYVIFDPNVDTLINTLLPMYIQNSIYAKLLEATTSELAARMTAMSNATKNAEDVINRLVLKYNKARQASITQEISEIVGGAAAL